MLSRSPLPDKPLDIPVPGETTVLMDMLHSLPVTSVEIKNWTDWDPILSKVRKMVLSGWQNTTDEDLKPYQQRCNELTIHDAWMCAVGNESHSAPSWSFKDSTRVT